RARPDFADELRGAYLRESGDEMLPLVLRFYECYRAYVRGKVNSLLSDDEHAEPRERRKAATDARRYFALAAAYARERLPTALVVMSGLSGVGKSYIADALAGRLGAVILSTDRLRNPREATSAQRDSGFDEGIYAPESR